MSTPVNPLDQLDEMIRKLEELRNHLKWIKRGEEGWTTEGLVTQGIPERIEKAYTEILKPENVALLNRLGIPVPDKRNWRHFKLETTDNTTTQ